MIKRLFIIWLFLGVFIQAQAHAAYQDAEERSMPEKAGRTAKFFTLKKSFAICKTNCEDLRRNCNEDEWCCDSVASCANKTASVVAGFKVTKTQGVRFQGKAEARAGSCGTGYLTVQITCTDGYVLEKVVPLCVEGCGDCGCISFSRTLKRKDGKPIIGKGKVILGASDWCSILYSLTVKAVP